MFRNDLNMYIYRRTDDCFHYQIICRLFSVVLSIKHQKLVKILKDGVYIKTVCFVVIRY